MANKSSLKKTGYTKTRGEVAGSRKKIGPQKGSGGARHGNITAPIFVGGGIAHGPKAKGKHRVKRLNKKVRSSTWTDVSCGDYHTLAIKSDGALWGWGYNGYGQVGDGTTNSRSSPVQIGSRTDWVKIAAGYYGSIGITADGKMWAWGYTWNLDK